MPFKNPVERKAYRASEPVRAKKHAYNEAHREEIRAKDRERYLANIEERRAKKRVYAREHYQARREYTKAYNAAHTERANELSKLRYANASEEEKEKRRENEQLYRQKNVETIRIRQHGAYMLHREERQAKNEAYRKAHPEIWNEAAKRRRAAKLQAPLNDFTHQQWIILQATFRHRCAYCGKRAKGHLTQDHVQPLSKGGSHTLSNIVPTCRPCNSKKGVKGPIIQVQTLLL